MSTSNLLNTQRRLAYASTEDFVALDAKHWAIEPFIPINTAELIDTLVERWGLWGEQNAEVANGVDVRPALDAQQLRAVYCGFDDLLHHRYRPLFTRFAQRYSELDPDRDTRPIIPLAGASRRDRFPSEPSKGRNDAAEVTGDRAHADAVPPPATQVYAAADSPDNAGSTVDAETSAPADWYNDVQRITEVGRLVMGDAGYTELRREELEKAVGVYSHWGVPLHVDFNVFDAIVVFARGDVVGKRTKRFWQKFYREIELEVSLYQRVVVMFKLRPGIRTEDDLDDSLLHLRMFKNIPKQDIDMLLPGTRVKFSWFDHFRNVVPSLGGISVTLFKIARIGLFVAAITLNIAAVLFGLFLALIGYMIRSFINHRNAKNRYMLNLTRSLYYQKLDTNAGVAYRLLEEAETQRHRECILAYYALLSAGQPISLRRFRRRVERMVREMVDVEIQYRATEAIELLETWGLIDFNEDGRMQTCPPPEALKRIGRYWDSLFQ